MANETKLEAWLGGLHEWATRPVKRARSYRIPLHDVEGIVSVAHNRSSAIISAAYLVHHDEFDRLTHGRVCGAGMIIVQCGFVMPPYRSKLAYPEKPQMIDDLTKTIKAEAPLFFSQLNSLESVYVELTSDKPVFETAHPSAASLRQMFAAVVAFLLERDWRAHMETAFMKNRVSDAWLKDVAARLEASQATRIAMR